MKENYHKAPAPLRQPLTATCAAAEAAAAQAAAVNAGLGQAI